MGRFCRAGHVESPRTWGWTEPQLVMAPIVERVPTHVGMDRHGGDAVPGERQSPHARGDGPQHGGELFGGVSRVPTHVGMDRSSWATGPAFHKSPHARGDGPTASKPELRQIEESPRTWGWTDLHVHQDLLVLPESPRTWGWTGLARLLAREERRVPTHVGMDRTGSYSRCRYTQSPHARGDGPHPPSAITAPITESPRTWGWTVFFCPAPDAYNRVPTHVGMDRAEDEESSSP